MKPRFRFVGALVALLALSAYLAEGLWASVCAPETGHAGVESVVGQESPHGGCATDVGHAAPERDSTEPGESHDSRAPKCPLGPLGVGGSCVAAPLPTPETHMAASLPEDAHRSLPPDGVRDLLLAAPLFHPPRA